MNEYLIFNQHEVLNADDRSLILGIIKEVEPITIESHCLYSLFDGYYDDRLLDAISDNTNIDATLYSQLVALVNKITVAALNNIAR